MQSPSGEMSFAETFVTHRPAFFSAPQGGAPRAPLSSAETGATSGRWPERRMRRAPRYKSARRCRDQRSPPGREKCPLSSPSRRGAARRDASAWPTGCQLARGHRATRPRSGQPEWEQCIPRICPLPHRLQPTSLEPPSLPQREKRRLPRARADRCDRLTSWVCQGKRA